MMVHEAAELFPMAEESLADLAADIAQHGQRIPIELYEGKILDGRRRWQACGLAGVEPQTMAVHPPDPVAYVLSLNLHRRHLTPSQLAMVAARARAIYDRQARERQDATRRQGDHAPVVESLPQRDHSRARDAAGKAVGVSGKSVDHASKVLAKGTPELVAAVDQGRMAVSTAAVLATEPPEEQRVQAGRSARVYRAGPGGGRKPPPQRHAVVNGVVYDGLRYGGMAIEQLKRILPADPNRVQALTQVAAWCHKELAKVTERSPA